jgi:excisionase family DNA binding protein
MRTYTISEAAEATGLSRKAIARRIERGSLRSLVRNGRRRIPRSELVRAGLLAQAGDADFDPGTLLVPRPAPADDQGSSGRAEDLLVALVRELLDRVERQAGEVAQMRALTVEAESLRLNQELADLRVRLAELERGQPPAATSAPTGEVGHRISELSRQVEELARREIWLPPQAVRPGPAMPMRTTAPPQPAGRTPSGGDATSTVAARRPLARTARFGVEVAFIVVVALGAWLADLSPLAIAGTMAAAWALVAVVEARSSARGR